ncbi:hypothetical protein Tco_1217442 [Tanacetum coccineum]
MVKMVPYEAFACPCGARDVVLRESIFNTSTLFSRSFNNSKLFSGNSRMQSAQTASTADKITVIIIPEEDIQAKGGGEEVLLVVIPVKLVFGSRKFFFRNTSPAMQPLDKADTLIQKHSNPEWFPKKSGLAKRRTTWFDLFLKSDTDKDENHILGSSTVAITKKFKELIQKDELTIANLEGAGLERLKVQYNNDVELEYHVSQLKAAVLSKD